MSEKQAAANDLARLADEVREVAERHRLATLAHLLGLVAAESALQGQNPEPVKVAADRGKPAQSASGTREGPP